MVAWFLSVILLWLPILVLTDTVFWVIVFFGEAESLTCVLLQVVLLFSKLVSEHTCC